MRFILILALATQAGSVFAADATIKPFETSFTQFEADAFEGSEYRKAVEGAMLEQQSSAASWNQLQPVLDFCNAKQSTPDQIFVSVSTQAEAAEFKQSNRATGKISLLDMACPRAYHAGAFLSVNEGKTREAFQFLDKAIALAPYWALPHAERGFLFNATGDRAKALVAYRRALELAQSYPHSAFVEGSAFRGIGWTLVELGDLAGAKQAYQDSLRVDPASKGAQAEVEYIEGLQKSGGPLPKTPPLSTVSRVDRATNGMDRFVQFTRVLETEPFHRDAVEMRAWMIKWLENSPEVTVTVCDFLQLTKVGKEVYASELLVQTMFGNASYQIEGTGPLDEASLQLAGTRSGLKAYSAILSSRPKARIAQLDDLIGSESRGDLAETLAPRIAKHCQSPTSDGPAD